MLLFRTLGSWVRGLYLMAFGAVWLAVSYYFSGSGMGSNPTMLGMGLMGGVTFASGLFIILRALSVTGQSTPAAKASTGWRDDGERTEIDSGFDPEAAISRYMENRAHADAKPSPPPPAPEALPSAPPRPTFGRKQV